MDGCTQYTNVCSLPSCWWGIIIYIVATLYLFIGVAIICDDFFTASLFVICKKLDIKADVAGATFMAAGSSAPELFTAIADVFGTQNSIGIGTIVGSAVFNIVMICGLSTTVTNQDLILDWRPLARDSSFYLFSIAMMVGVLWDNNVYLYESIFFLFVYAVYIMYMYFNEHLMNYCPTYLVPKPKDENDDVSDDDDDKNSKKFKLEDRPYDQPGLHNDDSDDDEKETEEKKEKKEKEEEEEEEKEAAEGGAGCSASFAVSSVSSNCT